MYVHKYTYSKYIHTLYHLKKYSNKNMNQHAKNMRLVGQMHQHLIISPIWVLQVAALKVLSSCGNFKVSMCRQSISAKDHSSQITKKTAAKLGKHNENNWNHHIYKCLYSTFVWMDFWLAKDSTWLNYYTSVIPNATSWLTHRKKSVQSEHIISPTKNTHSCCQGKLFRF